MMRVKIGPYKNWIGPYQLAEMIPFLKEDQKDRLGECLAQTWVANVCDWIDKLRGERTIKVRIDPYDTWSMDNTLAHIILPMLKQLRDTKHGSGYVDDEDLPPQMRYSDPKVDENGWDLGDNWVHHKWDWVLNEMIWAFEQELDENWEDQFYHGTPNYVEIPVSCNEDGFKIHQNVDESKDCFKLKQTNPDYWVDYEGMKRYNERIQNGFRLFGKYYQNLWD
jgi:uncharacterized protein YukJ